MIGSDILGVVLAGGASRRLGRDKAALPWTGMPLAHHAAAVLGEVCREVVIAGPGELACPGVEAVADLFPGRGPLAGLHAGLERAGGRPIFALACDLPFVDAGLARYLVGLAIGRTGNAAATGGWAAADDDGTQPLCAVYAPQAGPVAAARLRAGKLSVRAFFEAIDGVAVPIVPGLDCYRREQLLNLNRPADLRRARRLQSASAGPPR